MPRKRASKKVAQKTPAVAPPQETHLTPPPVRRSSRSQTPSKKVRFQQDEPLTEREFDIIDRGLALKKASEQAKRKGLRPQDSKRRQQTTAAALKAQRKAEEWSASIDRDTAKKTAQKKAKE